MEEQDYNSRLHNLDLSRKKSELENIFDHVIDKIPDLRLATAYRWAGERDLFNQTSKFKLIPYRKQREVKRCLGPVELATSKQGEFSVQLRPMIRGEHRSFSPGFQPSGRGHQSEGSDTIPDQSSKYEQKQKIKDRYSKMHLKHALDKQNDPHRAGFDRLFVRKVDDDYPFASPMPSCMLTEENIDNLREIIVSSDEIEWKMLTPIRPESDYEEAYFDKLIQLHRNRYNCRLQLGYYSTQSQKSPFRHTRHSYLVNLNKHSHLSSSTMSLGLKLKHKFSTHHERLRSLGRLNPKLTLPTLTLTSDELSGSELLDNFEDNLNDVDDAQDLSYHSFSRFSKQNSIAPDKNKISKVATATTAADDRPTEIQEAATLETDGSGDELEEQVEAIISYLMAANMSP